MKLSLRSVLSTLSLVAFALVPTLALADGGSVSVVGGKFGDHVEQGHAVGDASSVFAAKKAVYAVDLANDGEATQVTLVWSVDGKEVQRQSLDIGRAPHWHTWGMRPIGGATKVDVQVLDAAGKMLKEDSLSAS
jgi:hypothetical protein